jgi:redox-sensitive bicupin YhaK (pirin superfamily)
MTFDTTLSPCKVLAFGIKKEVQTMSSTIKHIIKGQPKDLGGNFIVRRALPYRRQRLVGPFIFWDHMGPTEITPDNEMVVRAHPHIGLSTITYLFEGHIWHRDSLNNEVAIRPGEVNWMTAGSGVSHSERCKATDKNIPMEGIQLWVALPKNSEDVSPSFVHEKEESLPLIDHQGFQLRLIAGEALGQESPLPVFSKLYYLNGKSSGSGSMTFPVGTGEEAAVYIVSGELKADGQIFDKYTMLVFNEAQDIEFSTDGPCEFMILGGEIFPEERHIWWNFVSSDPEQIEAAKKRWLDDDFGVVINENERIPLPNS